MINSQGSDSWDKYLIALESAQPAICAIGVTDYYSTETYARVREAKRNGRLTNCLLIFPNIEMRLSIGTVKGKWVTHNANLVVNTDADQVIVAEVGPHLTGELPAITYRSGGLESEAIRKAVCDILEGGERAFQERARRLRVRLERA